MEGLVEHRASSVGGRDTQVLGFGSVEGGWGVCDG